MKIIGVIPARYDSSRFPGKPLADIYGKSMIQRVYEQAKKAKSLNEVVVATDDKRIYRHVEKFGNVVYTSREHQSGTERCNEAISIVNVNNEYNSTDVLINIQGDEPFIDPKQINLAASLFDNDNVEIATLIKKIDDSVELFDENVVKVIYRKNKTAIYFSRTAIPFCKNLHPEKWLDSFTFYKHIGIYAYRIGVLKNISELPVSNLEKKESLEQLRWIDNGYSIHVAETQSETYSVDSPSDIKKIPHNLA